MRVEVFDFESAIWLSRRKKSLGIFFHHPLETNALFKRVHVGNDQGFFRGETRSYKTFANKGDLTPRAKLLHPKDL